MGGNYLTSDKNKLKKKIKLWKCYCFQRSGIIIFFIPITFFSENKQAEQFVSTQLS